MATDHTVGSQAAPACPETDDGSHAHRHITTVETPTDTISVGLCVACGRRTAIYQ